MGRESHETENESSINYDTMERTKLLSQLKDIEAWANGLQHATSKLIKQLEKEESAARPKGSKVPEAVLLRVIATRRKNLLRKK
jgi:hypothetical protein